MINLPLDIDELRIVKRALNEYYESFNTPKSDKLEAVDLLETIEEIEEGSDELRF